MAVNVDYVQAGGYTAIQARQGAAAMLAKSALLTARAGIVPSTGGDFAVTAQGTPNMTVNVAAGQLVIPDAAGAAYVGTNTATKVLTIAASDPTNPRLDLIIFRVYDNEAGDAVSTSNQTQPGSTAGTAPVQTKTGDVEVVPGTPNAVPVEPALPNTRCVVLKRVRVRAATASILTSDIETANTQIGFTAAQGGAVPVANSTERDALAKFPGAQAYRIDTKIVESCDGTNWSDTGWVTPTLGNSWVSFDGGATFDIPQYRRLNGVVYLKGLMKSGTGATTVFTLPAGSRPLKSIQFVAISDTGAAKIRITNAGALQVIAYTATGSNADVSLNGISFIAEA